MDLWSLKSRAKVSGNVFAFFFFFLFFFSFLNAFANRVSWEVQNAVYSYVGGKSLAILHTNVGKWVEGRVSPEVVAWHLVRGGSESRVRGACLVVEIVKGIQSDRCGERLTELLELAKKILFKTEREEKFECADLWIRTHWRRFWWGERREEEEEAMKVLMQKDRPTTRMQVWLATVLGWGREVEASGRENWSRVMQGGHYDEKDLLKIVALVQQYMGGAELDSNVLESGLGLGSVEVRPAMGLPAWLLYSVFLSRALLQSGRIAAAMEEMEASCRRAERGRHRLFAKSCLGISLVRLGRTEKGVSEVLESMAAEVNEEDEDLRRGERVWTAEEVLLLSLSSGSILWNGAGFQPDALLVAGLVAERQDNGVVLEKVVEELNRLVASGHCPSKAGSLWRFRAKLAILDPEGGQNNSRICSFFEKSLNLLSVSDHLWERTETSAAYIFWLEKEEDVGSVRWEDAVKALKDCVACLKERSSESSLAVLPLWIACVKLVDETRLEEQRTRGALQERRRVMESSPDGFITISLTGIVKMMNTAAARIFGYESSEVVGQNVNVLMLKKQRVAHDGYLKRYRQTGVASMLLKPRELQGLCKDGKVIDLELTASELKVGTLHMFTAVVRDITLKKVHERTLQQNQAWLLVEKARMEAILQRSPTAIVVIDSSAIIQVFSKAAESMFGLSADEVKGKNVKVLMGEDIAKRHDELIARFFQSNRSPFEGQARRLKGKKADGLLFDIELRLIAVEVPNQDRLAVGFISNMTEDAERRAELELEQKKLRCLLEATFDAVIMITAEGLITQFSQRAEVLFGWTQEEVVMKNVKLLMPESFASRHDQFLKQYLRTKQGRVIGKGRELEAMRKDGTTFRMLLTLGESILEDGTHFFVGYIRPLKDDHDGSDGSNAGRMGRELSEGNAPRQKEAVAISDQEEVLRLRMEVEVYKKLAGEKMTELEEFKMRKRVKKRKKKKKKNERGKKEEKSNSEVSEKDGKKNLKDDIDIHP
jgi:PAS domain S-box-containing protein